MRIAFLIYNAYGIGGTIRSTLNLASALAASGRHEVSVVSVHRPSDLPQLPTHPAVQLRALLDWRETSPPGTAATDGPANRRRCSRTRASPSEPWRRAH